MATIAYTASRLGQEYGGVIVTWTGLTFTGLDDGTPFELVEFDDRSIQFTGTFGAGGTVIFEGSNDGTNWVTLNDPGNAAISKGSASLEQVLEITRFVRPRVTAGDGTTSINAILLVTR